MSPHATSLQYCLALLANAPSGKEERHLDCKARVKLLTDNMTVDAEKLPEYAEKTTRIIQMHLAKLHSRRSL